MGDSMHSQIYRGAPNMTKCITWTGVEKSHMEQHQNLVITFEDISGLLLVLAGGLILAMIFIFLERLQQSAKWLLLCCVNAAGKFRQKW